MKKIIVLLLMGMFLTGCAKENKNTQEKDYSEYLFADVVWTRNGENDIETLKLNSDGTFTYYCSCGNSVNDSDLCESYTYNDKTKEIEFECFETTEEMVTKVKIVSVSEEMLELDFNGEIRTFEKESKQK